jgi:membrane protease YdiL (CAAX protease family)
MPMEFSIIFLLYLSYVVYRANQEHQSGVITQFMRNLLYASVGLMIFAGVSMLGISASGPELAEYAEQNADAVVIDVDTGSALLAFFMASFMAYASFILIRSSEARLRLQGLIGNVRMQETEIIDPEEKILPPANINRGSYNPDSVVHTTAIVLCFLMLTIQIITFVAIGGVSGMADDIETEGIASTEVIIQAVAQLLLVFIGVGWATRRTMPQILERLGLRLPNGDDWRWGIGAGVMLIGLIMVFGIIIGILVELGLAPDQSANNEAADSLVRAFSTIPLAIILSASAAIGEEILFRGALQPVFGNLAVSIIFALMHTQNLFSPGILIIFAVSYVLGIIRQRQSTSAAIIGHFVYNFTQLLLFMAASSVAGA